MLGSLVAFLPAGPAAARSRAARELAAATGLALILASVCLYNSQTPFPGYAALPPCLGSALLLWADRRGEGTRLTAVGALLAGRVPVFMGSISYSLYLWHWPFLAYSHYLALTFVPAAERAAMVGLGFLCAVLSWRYVETPFRKRALAPTGRRMFAFAGAGLGVVLCGGLVCAAMRGFPQRLSPQARVFASAKTDFLYDIQLTADDVRAGRLVPIGAADPALRPSVLVWGDSLAMAALPAVDALLKEKGLAGRAAAHSATAPILGWYKVKEHGLGGDSARLQ